MTDITDGNADEILLAITSGRPWPMSLRGSSDSISEGEPFDLVIGDMLYTQLLHPALTQVRIGKDTKSTAMRHYDAPLTLQAVTRLHASSAGIVIHIHDLACWSEKHAQKTSLAETLTDPASLWRNLVRHDSCDPHLAAKSLPGTLVGTAWWHWPFYAKKDFLVRASVIDVSR